MKTRVSLKYFVTDCSLNNLKTRVDDLDLGQLKTFPIDLK